jgi:actin cytoskeleton-regulatory complex protein SLA1
VKAVYDYDATSSEELTIKENDTLLAFDAEGDWLLVQREAEGGKAGLVPASYVEVWSSLIFVFFAYALSLPQPSEGEESKPVLASQIVVPPSVRCHHVQRDVR